jgi:glyoxylate reductase
LGKASIDKINVEHEIHEPIHRSIRVSILLRIKRSVYIMRKIPEPGPTMLSRKYSVTMNRKSLSPPREEILRNVVNKDALLCSLSERIDKEVMEKAGPKLKVISTLSTGYDHIDVKEAKKRGIHVTFTGEVLSEATADLTFALILAISRKIVLADNYIRQKKWKVGWSPDLFLGSNVYGKTLGLIGAGRIGRAVARRAKGFDMNIIYHNRRRLETKAEHEMGAKYVKLDTLLRESDYLSIHANLNTESTDMMNESKLKRMKNTAFLINTSRGQVIDERSLVKALRKKWIAGAALDVFESEPLETNSPLIKMENLVLLPHIGSATYQVRSKMSEIAAQNIIELLSGRKTPFMVR